MTQRLYKLAITEERITYHTVTASSKAEAKRVAEQRPALTRTGYSPTRRSRATILEETEIE